MARPARWLGGNLARAVAVAPTIEVLIVVVILTVIGAVPHTIEVGIVIGILIVAVAVAPTIEVFMTPAGLTGCFLAIALFRSEKENDVQPIRSIVSWRIQ